jgi:glutathione peroxidase-family protein
MEQEPRHPLYQFLIPFPNVGLLCGNFHKFITNRKGQPVAIFHNGTLLDAFYNS